jgi:hypothetical protein
MRAACLPAEARALSSRGAAARPLPCGRAAAARRGAVRPVAAAAAENGESFDARAFRRALGQSENYTRKHMRDEDAAKAMEEQGVGAVSAGASVCVFWFSSAPKKRRFRRAGWRHAARR